MWRLSGRFLVREEQKDPRKQALALFEEMAARRQ
jgi:hypothetical protein